MPQLIVESFDCHFLYYCYVLARILQVALVVHSILCTFCSAHIENAIQAQNIAYKNNNI